MLHAQRIVPAKLWDYFQEIEPQLLRYPGIDPLSFRQAVLRIIPPEKKAI